MATPLDFEQFRKDAADLFANLESQLFEVTDAAKSLAEKLKDTTLETRKGFENTTAVKNSLSETLSIAARLGTEYISQERVTEKIQKNQTLLQSIQSKITREQTNYTNALSAAGRSTRSIADIEKDIYDSVNSTDRAVRKAALSRITTEERRLYLLFEQEKVLKEEELTLKEINDNLDSGNEKVKNATARASALAKVFDQISRIPYLKNFMDFKKIASEFDKGFKPGLVSLGSELKKAITNPLFLGLLAVTAIIAAIKALIKLTFEYDKITTDVANNLALSAESSRSLLKTFKDISADGVKLVGTLDAAFLSVKNQAGALLELQDTLQTNALFSNEMIQNQILLTKQMKLSKEEAAGIQKLSLLSGKSAESILDNAVSQNKTAVSYRKIISDISKINGEISVMYKNNPELIARAVIEANKLGVSLEQTQRISKSLLDFETSIGAELEAELLTGKRFNFEKARALALDGKSVEATKEILDQMGGLEGLTKLNVIQRDRLANSIGLSGEELATAAREQAILNKLGFENKKALEERYEILRRNNDQAGLAALQAEAAKKEGGEMLLKDIARANLQDRFNESMEQLKQILTETLSGPMTGLIKSMISFLSNTTALKAVLATVLGLAVGIATAITVATGGIAAITGGIAAAGVGLGTYSLLSSSGEGAEKTLTPNIVKSQTPNTPSPVTQQSLEQSDLSKRAEAMPVKDSILAPSDNNYIKTNNKVAKADKKDFIITTPDVGGLNKIIKNEKQTSISSKNTTNKEDYVSITKNINNLIETKKESDILNTKNLTNILNSNKEETKKDIVLNTKTLSSVLSNKEENKINRLDQIVNRVTSQSLEPRTNVNNIDKKSVVSPNLLSSIPKIEPIIPDISISIPKIEPTSPNVAKLPEAPAPQPIYKTDVAMQNQDRRDDRNREFNNEDRKQVLENHITLTIDTIPVAVAQNKVNYPRYA